MRLIIHPGYSRTATTYLQDNIFCSLNSIFYLGKHLNKKYKLNLDNKNYAY